MHLDPLNPDSDPEVSSSTKDPTVRKYAGIALASLALGWASGKRYGSPIEVVKIALSGSTVLLFGVLIYCILLSLSPVGDEPTAAKRDAARARQANARKGLLGLALLAMIVSIITSIMIEPVNTQLRFKIGFALLEARIAGIQNFFVVATPNVSPPPELFMDIDASKLFHKGDILDGQAILRLISKRKSAPLVGNYYEQHKDSNVVLAADKVVFDSSASIFIGDRDLFIFANEIVINEGSSPEHKSARITAFLPTDIPGNAGLKARQKGLPGEHGGSVTILVLSRISGRGKLSIDLRGQKGGTGSVGESPPQAAPAGAKENPPIAVFEFRRPNEPEKAERRKQIHDIEEHPELYNVPRERAVKIESQLETCFRSQECRFFFCEIPKWKEQAKGTPGVDGTPGSQGGEGGKSGNSGDLEVYYLDGSKTLAADITEHLVWFDGNAINTTPTARSGGEGGPPGVSALGQEGGPGVIGDPFGACPSGQQGTSGTSPRSEGIGPMDNSPVYPGHAVEPQALQLLEFVASKQD